MLEKVAYRVEALRDWADERFPVTAFWRDHLVKYYVMSRPIGWWGPVKREAKKRGLLKQKMGELK